MDQSGKSACFWLGLDTDTFCISRSNMTDFCRSQAPSLSRRALNMLIICVWIRAYLSWSAKGSSFAFRNKLIRTNFTHQYKLFQRWLLNLYIIVDQMILYKGLIDRSAILRTNDEGFRWAFLLSSLPRALSWKPEVFTALKRDRF